MIQKFGAKTLDRFASLAMTNQQRIAWFMEIAAKRSSGIAQKRAHVGPGLIDVQGIDAR
ncbi:MAG TPA: hypothetical protein VFN29_07190 [Chiayiivirga sp.]|nr:hypothetical protein [Chiayiivirga sp.]